MKYKKAKYGKLGLFTVKLIGRKEVYLTENAQVDLDCGVEIISKREFLKINKKSTIKILKKRLENRNDIVKDYLLEIETIEKDLDEAIKS